MLEPALRQAKAQALPFVFPFYLFLIGRPYVRAKANHCSVYERILQYIEWKLDEANELIPYPSGPSNDCVNAVRTQNIANIVLDELLDRLDVPLGGIRQCYARALEKLFRMVKRDCSDSDLEKIVDDYLADSGNEDYNRFAMFMVAKLAKNLRPA